MTARALRRPQPKRGTADRLRSKAKPKSSAGAADTSAGPSKNEYKSQLHHLQIELVKLQRHFIGCGDQILVVLEGRDAAGKDGSIKRIVEYLSPREFMRSVPKFEKMLVNSGITVLKYYLDIDKAEQRDRLAARARDPLKQWKSSPVDAVAIKHWKDYSAARDEMLLRTHTALSPWHIVRTNDKRSARLNLIRDILSRLDYDGKKHKLVQPDTDVAFTFTPDCIASHRLAR